MNIQSHFPIFGLHVGWGVSPSFHHLLVNGWSTLSHGVHWWGGIGWACTWCRCCGIHVGAIILCLAFEASLCWGVWSALNWDFRYMFLPYSSYDQGCVFPWPKYCFMIFLIQGSFSTFLSRRWAFIWRGVLTSLLAKASFAWSYHDTKFWPSLVLHQVSMGPHFVWFSSLGMRKGPQVWCLVGLGHLHPTLGTTLGYPPWGHLCFAWGTLVPSWGILTCLLGQWWWL